ncbi:MAG: DEAD/DEAH box helicase, partial [Candidatus Sungbacteria bacterium]|nr:DEAD/DEAH box helicase [Candidatus Sungbacteria bacterium]
MNNMTDTVTQENFYGLGISPSLIEVLEKNNFKSPTPIQAQAIPVAIEGKDVVGIAQTGTGKTLAFGIPMIQRLFQSKAQGLVVVPTRELASQVEESLARIGRSIGLKTAVLVGGTSLRPQVSALLRKPHIIIATPGRLIDHLQQKNVSLAHVSIVVLDEADRMLDMGFAPQIKRIFEALPNIRQTMLFSATMPPEIMKMAASQMKLPIRVEVAPAGTTADRVSQELFIVRREQKLSLLSKLLETYKGPTLVFARTKHGAAKIKRFIKSMGINAAEIHSNRSLGQRREALEGFKSGMYRVLVATDIASRGIDVVGIELVLNFDLPMNSDDYVHRIGRTARAGAKGHSITFAMPDERREIQSIERLTKKLFPISQLPELPHVEIPVGLPEERERPYHARAPRRDFRGGGNGGNRQYS